MTATEPAAEIQTPPMAPKKRRLTMAVLWVTFALWVAALLAMYFVTVYPQRHHGAAPSTQPLPSQR